MMKIFIYWNYKDRDSKKIYQFLSQSDFRNKILEEQETFLYNPHSDFLIDQALCDKITKSDLILFFTHGDDDAILKFRYINDLVKSRFVFVDLNNAELLKDKKVIAICCRSAKTLGHYCVSDAIKSKFFVGFQDDLIYSEEFSVKFKNIVYKTYSDAFEKALEKAYTEKWSAEKFTRFLKKYIIDMLTKEILNSTDRKLGSISGITFHRKTAESLIALGETQQLIFE